MGKMKRLNSLLVWIFALVTCAFPVVAQTDKIADLVRRADAAFDDENRKLAQKLYLDVVALNPEQSHSVYRLGQLANGDEAALAWFERYVKLEPDDAWGWIAAGDKYLRVGKSCRSSRGFSTCGKARAGSQGDPAASGKSTTAGGACTGAAGRVFERFRRKPDLEIRLERGCGDPIGLPHRSQGFAFTHQ